MAEVAFLRADGHAAAKQGFGGLRFSDIALLGGGAVAVDIADLRGLKPCVFQSQRHAALHSGFLRPGNVAAVAVGTVAHDFGINFRAARLRMHQRFEHQYARALANHQAVAPRIVRARGFRRLVVAAAGGIERVEHIHFRRAEFFAAAGQHHFYHAVFDGFISIAYALAAR